MPRVRPTVIAVFAAGALVLPAASASAAAPGAPGPTPAPAPADAPAPVTTASSLSMRSAPGGRVVARLPRLTRVTVLCQRNGPIAAGRTGATRVWDRIRARGRTGWVSDGWVETGTSGLVAPFCGVPAPDPAATGSGRCATASPFPLLPPAATPEEFIASALPGARTSRERYGVPVSVTLAQAILETGAGRVAALANNFFGMKAQVLGPRVWSWEDIAGACVFKKTWEVRRGRTATEIAAFRAYASLDASILDHGRRVATNPVYRPAFAHADHPRRFATEVARRYATDPAYARKLHALMTRHGLERHDTP